MNYPTPILNPQTVARVALCEKVFRKCHESMATKEHFFRDHARRLIESCEAMAQAFNRGGRLFVLGSAGTSFDPDHVARIFTQPILAQRPGLPAIALCIEPTPFHAVSNGEDCSLALAQQLRSHASAGDMVFGLSPTAPSTEIVQALQVARELSLLTVGFSGWESGGLPEVCDFCFSVPSLNIHRILETHETLLHMIWDTIHVLRGERDVL